MRSARLFKRVLTSTELGSAVNGPARKGLQEASAQYRCSLQSSEIPAFSGSLSWCQGPFRAACRGGVGASRPVGQHGYFTAVSDRTRHAAKLASAALYSRLPKSVTMLYDYVKSSPNLQRVLGLQAAAFWQNHYNKITAVALLTGGYMLWRVVSGTVSTFSRSDNAGLGSMVVAAGLLLAGYMLLRQRYAVDPHAVYRLALLRLNTHPGILDVMGAPLAGAEMNGYLVSGGGLRTKGLGFRFQSRRVHMVFPLRGSERRGLAFMEAKKRKGTYIIKVLGVDVPSHGGQEERLYAVGDSTTYNQGGVLDALRIPVVKAYQLKKAYDQDDDKDEAADMDEHQRRWQEKAAERALRAPKPMDEGGGMYAYERAYWGAVRVVKQIRSWMQPTGQRDRG